MYRGRTTLKEALELPNRVFNTLFHMKRQELDKEEGKNKEAAQLMEEEFTGG